MPTPKPASPLALTLPEARAGRQLRNLRGSERPALRLGACAACAAWRGAQGPPWGRVHGRPGLRHGALGAVELLAAVKAHAGSLDRVAKFAELQGFLNTTPDLRHTPECAGRRLRPVG